MKARLTTQLHHMIPPVVPPPNCFTVLVVDDTEAIRTFLKRFFESVGYAAVGAADPLEALALLTDGGRAPDLIVTDVEMPGMDGIEFVRRLRDLGEPFASVPVLTTSGASREELEPRALEAGSDGFLSKPFDIATLKAEVASILKRRGSVPRGIGGELVSPAPRNRLKSGSPVRRS